MYETVRSNEWLSGRNDSATSSSDSCRTCAPAFMLETRLRVRQHHALGLARRAGGVDDRRQLRRARTPRARSRNSLPAPHSPVRRAWPRSATVSSEMTEGLSPSAIHPSGRPTSSAGSLCRTSWIFSSCERVETMAALAPAVLQDVAGLSRGQRRVDRNRDRPGGEDGQVGHHPFGPALGDDRDAIARPHAERAKPEREVADALEELLARQRIDPVRAAASDQPGF